MENSRMATKKKKPLEINSDITTCSVIEKTEPAPVQSPTESVLDVLAEEYPDLLREPSPVGFLEAILRELVMARRK
jgi:hypothetical protein